MATVHEDKDVNAQNGKATDPVAPPLSMSMNSTESYNVFDFLQHRILTHYPQAVQIRNREMPESCMAIVYPYLCM